MRIVTSCVLAFALSGWGAAYAQVYDSSAAASAGIYRPVPPSPEPGTPASPVDTNDAAAPADTTARGSAVAPGAADTSGADTAGTDTTGADTTGADTAATDTSGSDTTRTESPDPDTTRADTIASDTARADTTDSVAIGLVVPEDTATLTARMDVRRGGGLRRSEFPDLWGSAVLTGRYRTFLDLLARSSLRTRLTSDSLVTVLAPTDSAFARLPAREVGRLREDPAWLDAWLGSVLLDGSLGSRELVLVGEVTSLGGSIIRFSRDTGGSIRAGAARLVQVDLIARNGTLHGVDRVILPEAISATP